MKSNHHFAVRLLGDENKREVLAQGNSPAGPRFREVIQEERDQPSSFHGKEIKKLTAKASVEERKQFDVDENESIWKTTGHFDRRGLPIKTSRMAVPDNIFVRKVPTSCNSE